MCYTSYLIWWRFLSCIGLLSWLNFLFGFCSVWSYLPWFIIIIRNYRWIWWFLALCQAWTISIVISSCTVCLLSWDEGRFFYFVYISPSWLVIRKMISLSNVKNFFSNCWIFCCLIFFPNNKVFRLCHISLVLFNPAKGKQTRCVSI